ncbi:transglutaminase family protein [Rhodopirellula sp. JC740]|uniref:Transglutaminase family protein n=1 Tax=Rhodopirellula halodulae TaxID=2894198 RepID=A0ABS8NC38_9BACT|nr:transglutaminase family protein [Rhodopirellula sp. JC740]
MNELDSQPDPCGFLAACDVIDSDHDAVVTRARGLVGGTVEETAKKCFEFVRDSIQHSGDARRGPVTCRASDVLKHGIGYCYAKSHLLCALLRANQIPAGLCYQRLSVDGDGAPFCLHGLNAVHLPGHGWYRIDARGNKRGVHAMFHPPREQLAFRPMITGESELPGIWSTPHPKVKRCLLSHDDWNELARDLPDVDSNERITRG